MCMLRRTRNDPTMERMIFFGIALFSVLAVVSGVDPLIGNASYYTPTGFSRTACEGKSGSSKLPPLVYPVAVAEKLWDRGAGCLRRYHVRCISDGAPRFCKTGVVIEVSIQDRAATMRSPASEDGADMIIPKSGFKEIADPFEHSVPIQYEELA